MKKFFLLIPALFIAMMANATSTTISPESATSDNNIRAAFNGTADTIYLNPGEYIQENQIHFKRSAVLIAVDKSNKPIIKLKFYCDLINENSKVFVDGLIFDGSVSGQQCVRPYDATTGKELHFNDCEFYNFAKTAISGDKADCALDSCVVNNCKFYDNNRSCIYIQSANLAGVKVTNSTFANIKNVSGGDYASPIDIGSASANVLVDHCTMYNCATIDANYNYINVASTSDVIVSNSIFASEEGYNCCGTYLKAGGSVANCLTYNLTNWQGANANYGHVASGGATISNCVKANPLFKDAANGDFSLYASSPARGAGDDASDLGDPRWYKALAPVAIPATLVPFDALLSEKASIIQGTPDSIFLKTESTTIIEWAKWNVSVEEDGLYDFTAYAKRTGSDGSQRLQIDVLNSTETETLKSNAKTGLPNECTISTGAVNLIAGNTYIIKVYNNYDWAESKLIKVEASYAGGKTIAIPDTLRAIDALKSERAFVNEAGELRFTDDGHSGYVRDQYGKWNISVAKAGNYKFTVSANSDNSHAYELILRNSTETSDIATIIGVGQYGQALKFSLDVENLAIGNYVLNIRDTTNYSHGRIEYIAASYEGGAVVNAPGEIQAVEAVIYDNGYKKMFHNADGDLEYGNSSTPSGEYAYWNINATEAGEMAVSFNSPSGGHNFLFELYEGTTLLGSVSEEGTDAIWEHNVTLANHLTIPAAGTYTLRVHNRTQWSSAILHSVTIEPYVAPAALEINEAAIDNSAWVANVGGAAANVKLIRTFKGGVYNSICVPFEASMSKIKAAFGDDVELLYLEDANMSGDILNLVFANAPDFYQGTPYLIKPSADVVNPEFTNVNLLAEEAASTSHTGWPASFIGTFVNQNIAANPNNLYLGTDNKLYFSNNDVTIKGLRAYFVVNVPNPQQNIKAARIVKGTQVMTDVELVGAKDQTLIKTIENGQLIIIRDGNRYNVMGSKIQ